ncbi:tRNA(Ile)-lysidine synthetase [gut metagenome]|uniref:tRNA(Ile)-lysidine synthetase n=1 Tax=gut metagenome TaxID=749906 RepID=J9CG85_9ZZZZ
MIQKVVEKYIQQQNLIKPHAKVLVALSGGADSVALLRLLVDLKYPCEAAHCNFHLRGEESKRDEDFVRQLCHRLQIKLHVIHFNTEEVAAKRHISIEMAARELRYQWFEEIRQAIGAKAIAVAHHQDDSVETFLLNLIRGTGINGLRGIRPKNGYIIRPLLALSRKDILSYLESIAQPYVTDSTNLQDAYLRNKIRLSVLPLLQTLNPSIQKSILQTAKHLEEASLIYQQGVEEAKQRILTEQGINIQRLLQEPAPQTLLHEILSPLGFNTTQISDLFHTLNSQSGKRFLAAHYQVVRDREWLLIDRRNAPQKPFLDYRTIDFSPDFQIPKGKDMACFDADLLTTPLTLRLYRPGDTFVPFGMKGRKKVSDYLTNRKFSIFQKERQWVLCCGEEIIWLVGERTDNRFRINENTRRICLIKCRQSND